MIRYTKPKRKRYMFFALYPDDVPFAGVLYWFPTVFNLFCGPSVKWRVYTQIATNTLLVLPCRVIIGKGKLKCNKDH